MIIDADAHFTPVLAYTGKSNLDKWIKNYLDRKSNMFSDADNRQLEMLMLGVDRQLLNPMGPSLGLNYQIDSCMTAEVMDIYNRTMYELIKPYDCYDINLWIGLQNIEQSVNEIKRYANDPKVFGVFVAETPLWGFIDEIEPVWAILEKVSMPWYMHLTKEEDQVPYKSAVPEQYKDLYQRLAGTPWTTSIASIILGGVLTRYPDLKIVIAERDIDWILKFQQDMLEFTDVDPIPYFRKNFWFTTEPESANFLKNAEVVGYSQLLFATDWPHDHDIGGSNSRNDVATVNNLNLSTENFNMLCKNNYLKIRNG